MAPAKKRSSFSMLKKAITSSIRFGATDGSEKCPMCLKNVFKVERVVCSGASWHKQCLGTSLFILIHVYIFLFIFMHLHKYQYH